MLRVGIVGATGYTGEELIRILISHPKVKITSVSRHTVDKSELISQIMPAFKGRLDLPCVGIDPSAIAKEVDLVFLALPHKAAMDIAPAFLAAGKSVIDLSADYRLPADIYKIWYGVEHKDKSHLSSAVYGLPELYREEIRASRFVANPGCYPTSIILGIAPALKSGIIAHDQIIIDSKSGTTGAGKKAEIALLFSEVNENFKAYKVNEHQHQPEIDRILSAIAHKETKVVFVPHLLPINRGILSTIYLKLTKASDAKAVIELYRTFYGDKSFVRILPDGIFPQIKDVAYTNYCNIGIKISGNTLIVVSCIDNLVKGASGQAIQNMNIMCGFDENSALA